jgi:hypothetical protein
LPLPSLHLPSVSSYLNKHWKTLTKDPKMTNIFSKSPVVVFKQPSNLKKVLCHAKLPSQLTPKRQLTGMRNAPTCSYIHHSKEVKSSITKETLFTKWTIQLPYQSCNLFHHLHQTLSWSNKIFNHLYVIHKKSNFYKPLKDFNLCR